MPESYYVSQYSGEEIDALLGGAGTGTVRYDAAQTLTAAQQTQARGNINAAPGGFGYGEYRAFKKWDDNDGSQLESYLDSLIDGTAKIIRFTELADYPSNILSGNAGWADVSIDNTGNIFVEWCGPTDVVAGTVIGMQKAYKKRLLDGTWLPWEYTNPPMTLGVEYRTTERYLGKPVYAQLVNLGAAPSPDTSKSTNITNAIYISLEGTLDYSSYRQVLPIFAADGSLAFQIKNSGDAIVVQSLHGTIDYSSQNVHVLAKYIKSTD